MSLRKPNPLFSHPAKLLGMGRALLAGNKPDLAARLGAEASAASSGLGLLGAIGQQIEALKIAGFHAGMLRDGPRNQAYAAGIAALAPGRRVLDIGTGSGLLAMLAARAGASHVYACEVEPRLAATAVEIIAANGLADRITVLPVHSSALDRDRDLAGGVDLVVSEIFSDNLLSEGVIASLNDAHARLCLPGAAILPGRAALRVALADLDGPGFADFTDPLGDVLGFDLAPFARHLRRSRRLPPGAASLRSPPADLFAFDFARPQPEEGRTAIQLVSAGGRITGVLQWIRFDAGPAVFENAPDAPRRSHWSLLHHGFAQPIETEPGQMLLVEAWHDLTTVLVWSDPAMP